ncbi:MAG: transcription antitermination factor NusB [Chlamydiae bacterium]|nr:transcription antitermination factor NusB [Chlamydiota bacterium]MBI3267152.1 transcription antitermination factor NusB [Chlamydiota bacterium]
MGYRRKSREFALQILYQLEINPENPKEALQNFWEEAPARENVKEFTHQLVLGTLAKKEKIDQTIQTSVKNWEINRLAVVDRNVIRMAVFEMLFLSATQDEIPAIVTINEAVDISKKYGTPDSGKFVNGVLDQIRKEFLKSK